jgi:hypothetical protein
MRALVFFACCLVSIHSEPPRHSTWEITFADEFTSPELDKSKWTPYYFWGRTQNNNLQYHADDDIIIENGICHLRAQKRTMYGTNCDKRIPACTTQYSAGCISSWGKFAQKYGYFEIRAKMPVGNGLWPNFWFMDDRNSPERPTGIWPPEIDAAEYNGERPNDMLFCLHWGENWRKRYYTGKTITNPQGFSNDFHTFGFEWNDTSMTWYVDNQQEFHVTVNDWATTVSIMGVKQYDSLMTDDERRSLLTKVHLPEYPMHFQAELSLKSSNVEGKAVDETTVFPCYFDVDYIRVYKRTGSNNVQIKYAADYSACGQLPIRTGLSFQISPVHQAVFDIAGRPCTRSFHPGISKYEPAHGLYIVIPDNGVTGKRTDNRDGVTFIKFIKCNKCNSVPVTCTSP